MDLPADSCCLPGLAAFFFLYILLEIPSQIALKKFGARWWISGMLVATGIVMSSASAIKSSTGFILFRLFLGLAECGVMPGEGFSRVGCQQGNPLMHMYSRHQRDYLCLVYP